MRRRLLIAAFLGTTALCTPTRADAGPVVAFVGGIGAALGGGTLAAGASAAATAGFAFASSAIGGIIINAVVGIGLSYLASALQPSPEIPKPGDRMVNYAQPVAYAETVYGQTRKGGPLGFSKFADGHRYYIPILAAHPIKGDFEHWLDEWPVDLYPGELSGGGVETVPPGNEAHIWHFSDGLSSGGQTELMGAFSEITAAHDFAGLAGAVVRATEVDGEEFGEDYPRGREWVYAPVIKGHNQLYDPRTDVRLYTDNAALVLAHWLSEVLGRDVDWDRVATEANRADALGWTINGTISDDQDFETQRAQLAGACDAYIYEGADGKVGFFVGRYYEPGVVLNGDDFFAVDVTQGENGSDAPTEIAVEYTEPENGWRETPAGTWVITTDERRKRQTPQLFMITNHTQASTVAKRLARVARPEYRLQGTLGPVGYELMGERFFRYRDPELGIDHVFEIGRLRREGVGSFSVEAVSVKEGDFGLAPGEEPDRPKFNAGEIDEERVTPPLAGVTATSVGGGQMEVTWDTPPDGYRQQVRIQRLGSGAGSGTLQLHNVPKGQNPVVISGLVDGAIYAYEARNKKALSGRASDWTPDPRGEVTIVNNDTAPDDLVAASATGGASAVTLEFTTANDPNQAAVEIRRGSTPTFSAATLVSTVYTPPNTEGSANDSGLGDGTYYYWLTPINGSGVGGTAEGPLMAVVSS